MRVLSKNEIDEMIFQGKSLSETEITAILDEFEKDQPEIYRAIYGEFSDGIMQENQDMGNLFLDLCFDIIWTYRKAFGKPPRIKNGEEWLMTSLSLLDAELKSLTDEIPMEEKFRNKLQERFVNRAIESGVQMALLKYLDIAVEKYASFKKERLSTVHVTNNLLFVIARLIDDLYNMKK